MPWWSWIVIWGCLVLAALATFGWLGYRIVIKFLQALHALGDLASKTEALQSHADELTSEQNGSAVFADAALLDDQHRARQAERRRWRQTRREARVRRGKILVNADPQQFSHLVKRT
ncbi:hypothetical protein [Rathayibacter soli]|uniref:hypothetical protein n=1 Tax=Rathayibacter soli TaxID=3144168 RepID=UPI0027E3E539|nr:hypothetical protein [Glaciibacter superstes]